MDRIFEEYSAVVAKELERDTVAHSPLACIIVLRHVGHISVLECSGVQFVFFPRCRKETWESFWPHRTLHHL